MGMTLIILMSWLGRLVPGISRMIRGMSGLLSGMLRAKFWSATLFGVLAFSLASALCLRASRVAPVRGGTYFSLPPQRKVGKRKRLTPPAFLLA
jgi:hypothetical protein